MSLPGLPRGCWPGSRGRQEWKELLKADSSSDSPARGSGLCSRFPFSSLDQAPGWKLWLSWAERGLLPAGGEMLEGYGTGIWKGMLSKQPHLLAGVFSPLRRRLCSQSPGLAASPLALQKALQKPSRSSPSDRDCIPGIPGGSQPWQGQTSWFAEAGQSPAAPIAARSGL